MKSWNFSRVFPPWLSILILILMPVFRLFRQSGFYFLAHGIQVSSFMSVPIFLSIDWNEKLHFSFYPSIAWLLGAFRLWVTCLNCVPLQRCSTFSRHQIIGQMVIMSHLENCIHWKLCSCWYCFYPIIFSAKYKRSMLNYFVAVIVWKTARWDYETIAEWWNSKVKRTCSFL